LLEIVIEEGPGLIEYFNEKKPLLEQIENDQIEIREEMTNNHNKFSALLAQTSSQIHEIERGERFDISEKSRKPKTMISFIDDDCRIEVYNELYPLIKSLNLPYGIACTTSYIDTPQYMTLAQLKEMHNDPLVDVMSHHHNGNILFDVATEEEAL